MEKIFFNYPFNKGKLKTLLIWSILNTGQYNMINLVENLKRVGFEYATTAGISLGIDDLKTISTKYDLIEKTNDNIKDITNHFNLAVLNEVEHSQKLINSWQKISEILKININRKFKTVNKLNPIYMMAFSGARGNISQVRQLIGMRGLMADPNGQIIHLPIKSNFREGLTVTEYLISCYGARKGVVDTALRTATAGYLTRRLVDTAQHVIISQLDCGTKQGIFLSNLYQGTEILLSLKDQLYGRVLGKDVKINTLMYLKNQQIDDSLSILLANKLKRAFIRSPLTCKASNSTLCQLCYGWNLSHSKLISLGEIVGVIAAQSIGEPGTQLTMRTFHTGGVFSGNVKSQLYSPFDGIIEYSSSLYGDIVNLYNGNFAFLVKRKGLIIINPIIKKIKPKKFEAILYTLVFVKNNEKVKKNQLIAQQSNKISNTQQIEGKYTVNSKLEGEIFFDCCAIN
ncbi:MAG: DNA-directed RNA polymerase subunit beta'' [Cyanobacteria bacterium J06636_27]